jgi:Gpi18-like mannosyltransferase
MLQQRWRRLPASFRFVVPLFLMARIGLSIYAVLSLQLFPPVSVPAEYLHNVEPAAGGLRGWLLGPWQRWDAFWYLRIASTGYATTDGSVAFFPLYPLTIRLAAPLLGYDYLLAATMVANVSCLAALFLLYKIALFESNHESARKAALYQVIFPTAFFLFAPYTESLFLLWSIACLYATRRRWWWKAGLFGFLAGLTRPTGVLLAVPLLWAGWRQNRVRQDRALSLLSAGLTLLGPVAYSLYLAVEMGQPLSWLHSQELDLWERTFTWPWETARQIIANPFQPLNNTLDLFFFLIFVALMVVVLRRLPTMYGLYMLTLLLLPLFTPRTGAPLYSMPRFVLVLFPGFMALGQMSERRLWRRIVLYSSLLLLAFFTSLFVAWYWVA